MKKSEHKTTEKSMVNVSCRMPKKDRAWLSKKAKERRTSSSQILRDIIRRAIARR